jgi:methylase of polypeptide subunit release factors
MKRYYHSALKTPKSSEAPIYFFRKKNSVAFVQNIEEGIPAKFNQCDIIYSEPAWKHGYTIFLNRAKTTGSYSEYLDAMVKFITLQNMPVVLILGKEAIKYFPKFDSALDITLNGYKTNVYAWRFDLKALGSITTNENLIESLALQFSCIGDFCCGYGNTGLSFYKKNKDFVMSDLNPQCIGYIKRYIEQYEA